MRRYAQRASYTRRRAWMRMTASMCCLYQMRVRAVRVMDCTAMAPHCCTASLLMASSLALRHSPALTGPCIARCSHSTCFIASSSVMRRSCSSGSAMRAANFMADTCLTARKKPLASMRRSPLSFALEKHRSMSLPFTLPPTRPNSRANLANLEPSMLSAAGYHVLSSSYVSLMIVIFSSWSKKLTRRRCSSGLSASSSCSPSATSDSSQERRTATPKFRSFFSEAAWSTVHSTRPSAYSRIHAGRTSSLSRITLQSSAASQSGPL